MAGASGLVGSALLKQLSADPAVRQTDLLVRRPIDRVCRGVEAFCADTLSAAMDAWRAAGRTCDVFICALGTTRRAAGSLAAFAAVDRDLVVQLAAAAQRAGARQVIVVSSVGADSGSRNDYLRTKGQMQDAVAALGFTRCDFLQPGLLRGDRGGAASRPAERIAQVLAPLADVLMLGRLRRYRSISATSVAKAAVSLAGTGKEGVYCQQFDEMTALASEQPA